MVIHFIKSQLFKLYSFASTIKHSGAFSLFRSLKSVFRFLVAEQHARRWCVAKSYPVFAAAVAVCLCSCQKEKLNDSATLNSTSSSGSSAEARSGFGLPWQHKDPVILYGSLIDAPETGNSAEFEFAVGDQLGISCLRERVVVPARSLSVNLVPELNTRYKVLLNFVTPNSSDGSLLPFVSDLVQYQIDLNNILNTFTVMPEVAVIENEEGNRFYYSGTASEYIDQLNAAILVMHARGIKVANGGLGGGLEYLVYQDLLDQGKEDAAEEFRKITHVTPNNPHTQEKGAFVDELLTNYATMDLDYVNFHWKCSSPDDVEALEDAINYLKKRCNKPIISNELGQFDKDPNTLLEMMQLCTDAKMPYVLWYSPDENAGKRDTPLQHNDATLTRTGVAYQGFLAD
ncbi:hypothetical protein FC093_05210 [Ilyomonas limi]|uniref:Asl1-like glycosyl hydrolase catalytic domain-containing protein n=1 Tax=Ilyomonas limi TaxID=2575867 RepID=A0A4U3L6Y5_9BACT|nr:hypothetical protein [Ilyomonas limi]TKK70154.1 hypothetical protein FC093_05210 [Ilyomonas limi]